MSWSAPTSHVRLDERESESVMRRTIRPHGLVSTRNLAAASVAFGTGVGLAAAAQPAYASRYYSACADPKVNHVDPQSWTGWVNTIGQADETCSATREGIPCVGYKNSTSAWGCPGTDIQKFSISSYFTIDVHPLVRLCGSCAGIKFTNRHFLVGSAS